MALAASTIDDIVNRWSYEAVAEASQKSNYRNDQTINEAALERSVRNTQWYVQSRIGVGNAGEASVPVIELLPHFMQWPGGNAGVLETWEATFGKMVPAGGIGASTGAAVGSPNDHRRYTGADYMRELEAGFQRNDRPARGTQ